MPKKNMTASIYLRLKLGLVSFCLLRTSETSADVTLLPLSVLVGKQKDKLCFILEICPSRYSMADPLQIDGRVRGAG